MCKKMLQGLMGGGKEPEVAARPESNYTAGKEANVIGAVAPNATPAASKTRLSGGMSDNRRGRGVPGLGL